MKKGFILRNIYWFTWSFVIFLLWTQEIGDWIVQTNNLLALLLYFFGSVSAIMIIMGVLVKGADYINN